MTSDNCTVCGERTRYDGHEIAHSCAGGAPASNLPERNLLLVSVSTMNGRIAEAVAAEREVCRRIAHAHADHERGQCGGDCAWQIAEQIKERGTQ